MDYLEDSERAAALRIAARCLGKQPEQVTGYELIMRSPYFNDMLEKAEEEFGVEITNYDRDCIVTVDDLISVIGGKMNERSHEHGTRR